MKTKLVILEHWHAMSTKLYLHTTDVAEVIRIVQLTIDEHKSEVPYLSVRCHYRDSYPAGHQAKIEVDGWKDWKISPYNFAWAILRDLCSLGWEPYYHVGNMTEDAETWKVYLKITMED